MEPIQDRLMEPDGDRLMEPPRDRVMEPPLHEAAIGQGDQFPEKDR